MGGAGLFGGGGMYGGPAQQYAQLENMAKEAGLHVGKRRAHSIPRAPGRALTCSRRHGRGELVPDARGVCGIPPVGRHCVEAQGARGDQRRAEQSARLAPAALLGSLAVLSCIWVDVFCRVTDSESGLYTACATVVGS